jgi:hypothetical protein
LRENFKSRHKDSELALAREIKPAVDGLEHRPDSAFRQAEFGSRLSWRQTSTYCLGNTGLTSREPHLHELSLNTGPSLPKFVKQEKHARTERQLSNPVSRISPDRDSLNQ